MLQAIPGRRTLSGSVCKGSNRMKIFRNLLLAVVAVTILAGTALPANAAVRHHHRHHHRRK
jgi:hypothetical protein